MPHRFSVSARHPDAAAIAAAAELLRAGQLVAFPTETVYGLGALALDPEAVKRIYEAKGRPASNPMIVHVADVEMARGVAAAWPEAAERLAAAFWPGPLTLVLPKAEHVPLETTAGLQAVGVRMPAHPVALALIRATGEPLAAPSANRYMAISPTTAAHVAAGLGEAVALILDGGPATVGLESTVIDLTGPVPTVLRPGGVSVAALRAVLGTVAVRSAAEPETPLPSPGLARRHYAPEATVTLVPDGTALSERVAALLAAGLRVGALGRGQAPEGLDGLYFEHMPAEPEAYGARLYAALHDMDAHGVAQLVIESPPETEAWLAVWDRLRRAATV